MAILRTRPVRPQGLVMYEGPSMIDGKPIVMIATGFKRRSANPKTGENSPCDFGPFTPASISSIELGNRCRRSNSAAVITLPFDTLVIRLTRARRLLRRRVGRWSSIGPPSMRSERATFPEYCERCLSKLPCLWYGVTNQPPSAPKSGRRSEPNVTRESSQPRDHGRRSAESRGRGTGRSIACGRCPTDAALWRAGRGRERCPRWRCIPTRPWRRA